MPSTAKHWEAGKYELYQGQFSKTRMCRFFGAGACTKGAECSFAHGISEVTEPPNLRKTAICKAWKKSCCPKKADECDFAHGQSDLKKTLKFQGGSFKNMEDPLETNTRKATSQRYQQRSPKAASSHDVKKASGPPKVTSGSVTTSTQRLQSFQEDSTKEQAQQASFGHVPQASHSCVPHDSPEHQLQQQVLQLQQLQIQAARRQTPDNFLEKLQHQVLELQRLQLLREAEMHREAEMRQGVTTRTPTSSVAQGLSRVTGNFDLGGYVSQQNVLGLFGGDKAQGLCRNIGGFDDGYASQPSLLNLEPMRVPLPSMLEL